MNICLNCKINLSINIDKLIEKYKFQILPPPTDEELVDLDYGGCICDLAQQKVDVLEELKILLGYSI